MLDVVYRFRSSKKLLEFKELELRQIYLAGAHELNDPMEGYKNVVLRGDAVLWENLLRHDVLALVWLTTRFLVADSTFEEPKIPAALSEDDLPTDNFRKLYAEVCDDFFGRPGTRSVREQLTALERPLRPEGLRLVLSLVNPNAVAAVMEL